MLSLKKKVADFLKFDEETHSVEILPNAPGSIFSYSDGKKLDMTKLYNNFLSSVYHVVESLSLDADFCSAHNLETFSVVYTPCVGKIVF